MENIGSGTIQGSNSPLGSHLPKGDDFLKSANERKLSFEGGAVGIKGNSVRDAVDQVKQMKSECILSDLTYNHSMLFNKLVEARYRLNNITFSLGGPYEGEKENLRVEGLTEPEDNHISVYQHLLMSTQFIIADIYDDLERLEYLVSK